MVPRPAAIGQQSQSANGSPTKRDFAQAQSNLSVAGFFASVFISTAYIDGTESSVRCVAVPILMAPKAVADL